MLAFSGKFFQIGFIFSQLLFFLGTGLVGQNLIGAQRVASYSKSSLTGLLSFPAANGLDLYKIEYETKGIDSQLDTASGLIALPTELDQIKGSIAYQHGTTDGPEDVPSNIQGGSLFPLAYGSQGYFVSAADYLGLGESRGFHPYVHAATEAQAGLDMLLASRSFAADMGIDIGDHIFVAGYSQGGHGAMALHKAIQDRPTDDLWVTASAPMSGPYSISGVMKDLILGEEAYDFAAYIVYLVLGWQEVYGNFYSDLDEVFRAPYLDKIKSFRAGNIGVFSLNDFLITQLLALEGKKTPKSIFTESYLSIVRDSVDHPANLAFFDNDTYNWIPDAPMRIYYCEGDEQVPFKNALVADSAMNAMGAQDVASVLLDKSANHAQCGILAALGSLAFFNSFETTTSTSDLQNSNLDIRIHPNPATEYIGITTGDPNEKISFSIFDLTGKIVRSNQEIWDGPSIPVENWPKGIYIIQGRRAGTVWHRKLMIN